jgi:phosphoglycerate dehydrogenase-like enzyme
MYRVVYADPFFATRGERPDTGTFAIEREIFGASIELRTGPFADGSYVREGPLLQDAVRGADALVVSRVHVNDALIAALKPTCRVAIRQGIGFDNLHPPLLAQAGILGYNIPDYCVDEVSNHTLAMILALERRLIVQNAAIKADAWAVRAGGYPRRLSQLSLGIVGFGRIGQATARKAAAIYGRTVAYDPYVSADFMAGHRVDSAETLLALLAQADVVAVHALLNDETHHLIDAYALRHLKPGALLVNTARGGLVDPEAVLTRIEDGVMGGYASDVFDPEDPNTHPLNKQLLAFDNVIVSAHCAYLSTESEASLRRRVAQLALHVLETGDAPAFGRVA